MKIKIIHFAFFLVLTFTLVNCSSNEKKSGFDLLKSKADSYYKLGNYDSSKLYFTYLIQIDSLNGEYYFKRGYSNSMLLKQSESINDYLKAVELKYKPAKAFYNIGVNYELRNDSLALIYYKKCYEVDPSYPNVQDDIQDCSNRLKKGKFFTPH